MLYKRVRPLVANLDIPSFWRNKKNLKIPLKVSLFSAKSNILKIPPNMSMLLSEIKKGKGYLTLARPFWML